MRKGYFDLGAFADGTSSSIREWYRTEWSPSSSKYEVAQKCSEEPGMEGVRFQPYNLKVALPKIPREIHHGGGWIKWTMLVKLSVLSTSGNSVKQGYLLECATERHRWHRDGVRDEYPQSVIESYSTHITTDLTKLGAECRILHSQAPEHMI